MHTSTLMSIHPRHVLSILDGGKRVEYRRVVNWKPSVNRVMMYSTKPIGKCWGEFMFDEILTLDPQELWYRTSGFSGISYTEFNAYFKGKALANVLLIKSVTSYSKPLSLADLIGTDKGPQSWRYL